MSQGLELMLVDRAGYKTAIRHLRRNWFDQHGVLVLKKNESYFIVVDFKVLIL